MAKSESTKIEFGYFHDYESEQFAFYRIPKVLFTDEYFRNLSSDAKVLYGLMLDRMALSIRHQWFDEEGKVYIIFTVEQVIQYMNCGRDKAMKTLAELDTKKGIGLIEQQQLDEIVALIVETISIERENITISGVKYPYQFVKSRLLLLEESHIEYVLDCLHENTREVKNIKAYLLTCLMNSITTIGNYYQAKVNHDMYGGGI